MWQCSPETPMSGDNSGEWATEGSAIAIHLATTNDTLAKLFLTSNWLYWTSPASIPPSK